MHRIPALRRLAKRIMRGAVIRQRFHGGTICLDPVEHSWAWTGVHRYESFDRELQDKMLELARERDVLIDIGSNIGAITLSVILRNPRIAAVCIDPNQNATKLLRQSIQLNGLTERVEVIEAVVTPRGEPRRFDDAGSVTGRISEVGRDVVSIRLATLITSKALDRRCLLKIDVEGFETELLTVLPQLPMLGDICMVMELHPLGLNHRGDPARCLQALRDSGAVVTGMDGAVVGSVSATSFTQVIATWPQR